MQNGVVGFNHIHQRAWFHLGKFDKGIKTTYQLKDRSNGVYAFVINGDWKTKQSANSIIVSKWRNTTYGVPLSL